MCDFKNVFLRAINGCRCVLISIVPRLEGGVDLLAPHSSLACVATVSDTESEWDLHLAALKFDANHAHHHPKQDAKGGPLGKVVRFHVTTDYF